MRPTKLSANVFLELPPVLGHYLESERNQWLDSSPPAGRMALLNRQGTFTDIEALAVERRHFIQIVGYVRARALCFRIGFEQGRRDGARHFEVFGHNARLALQSAAVFGQLQGRYVAEPVRFEFDLEARTLYREVVLRASVERTIHKMACEAPEDAGCWATCGYFSGHTSEIVGRRVLTLADAGPSVAPTSCRLVSRFDPEWGEEADWAREALTMPPFEQELAEMEGAVETARQDTREAEARVADLNRRLRSDLLLETLVAGSTAMQDTMRRVRQAMQGVGSVLLIGEAGSGRETLARAIHGGGPRAAKPFVSMDCLALPGPLLAQELGGTSGNGKATRGRAYTGAIQRAHGGTLYLNEVAALSPEAQGLLVALLDEDEDDKRTARYDVRIVAAATDNLKDAVRKGMVREDLYYALTVLPIEVPPLRERSTDILSLAERFLAECAARYERPGVSMDREVRELFLACAWPGNLLQLKNVIEHAVILNQSGIIGVEDLPEEILVDRRQTAPQELSEEVVSAALRRCRGNRSQAARLLGVGRTSLWRAMKRFNIADVEPPR